jgi:Bacterial Ig-like domain (group 1)/Beta-propeller repeat
MSKNKSQRETVWVSFTSLTALLFAIAVGGTFLTSGSPVARAEDIASSPKPRIPMSSVGKSDAATQVRMSEAYGKLPLYFEANRGQTDAQVNFLSRGSGYTLFLTATEAVLSLRKSAAPASGEARDTQVTTGTVLRMQLIGANPAPAVAGLERLPGQVNYFIGHDPAKWRSNVPLYGKVKYEGVYPGIDLVYYGNQRQLEYDFVVAPGASPNAIRLKLEGAERLDIDARGDLVIHTARGEIRQRKPLIYQERGGTREEISGRYVLLSGRQVGFEVGPYDTAQPLVIDPTLVYSTYLGGSGAEYGTGIAVDTVGNAYVTGGTGSTNFPTTPGAFDTTSNGGGSDAFVTKLDPTGASLVYSTYLGGSGIDEGHGIAIDTVGNAYVTGRTDSTNFPTTPLAFDTTSNGSNDTFVTKLDPAGASLVYSTYLGGSGFDVGRGIAVNTLGNAYVTGATSSTNFPTTPGALDTTSDFAGDAFVTKLDPTGASLVYSTSLGGSGMDEGRGIAIDTAGNAYVTGRTDSTNFPTTALAFDTTSNGGSDAFVTKLDPLGASLVYSTYLGGSGLDLSPGIAIDTAGNAYVTGITESTNFPTTPGAFDISFNGVQDAFVTKLDPLGASLLYSTYLGGSSIDFGFGIAVDTAGNAYVTGRTDSTNFPTTAGAFDTSFNGFQDAFVTKLDPLGASLLYSTYLGGSSIDYGLGIAVDTAGNAYVTGQTFSTNFPTTAGAFDTTYNGSDVFVAKISEAVSPPATLTLSPPTATNPVGAQHCVTATVEDAAGNPVPDVTVQFMVTGAVTTSGSATTDENGEAEFCYQGPALPGADAITAFADTDDDGTQDVGEPSGAATKTWVLPVTTPLCTITITNGGRITANNGDKASFGGNAKADAKGKTSGQEQYQDHGPAQKMNVHSINVLAIVCQGTTQASIYGQATINGSGSFFYRINVRDLGEPGVGKDTYWILLQNGYNSGEHKLEAGNVQIRRK